MSIFDAIERGIKRVLRRKAEEVVEKEVEKAVDKAVTKELDKQGVTVSNGTSSTENKTVGEVVREAEANGTEVTVSTKSN